MIQFRRIVSPITIIENIAISRGIRELKRLRRLHGGRRWRKVKGTAQVELINGNIAWLSCIGMKRTESERKT
jgi:hypothetical protein